MLVASIHELIQLYCSVLLLYLWRYFTLPCVLWNHTVLTYSSKNRLVPRSRCKFTSYRTQRDLFKLLDPSMRSKSRTGSSSDPIHNRTGRNGRILTRFIFTCFQGAIAFARCIFKGLEVFLAARRRTASSAKIDNKAKGRNMPKWRGQLVPGIHFSSVIHAGKESTSLSSNEPSPLLHEEGKSAGDGWGAHARARTQSASQIWVISRRVKKSAGK